MVGALFRLRRSRRGRWAFAAGWGAFAVVIAFLAARHFATQSWPLSNGQPGVLAAVGLLLLLAQAFKAYGWGRLFARAERPGPLAGVGIAVRVGLGIVAFAGVLAAALILALPRLARSRRVLRFRLGRWLNPRTTSRRGVMEAWSLVSACWLVRGIALFLLLGTLGLGFSLTLALLFLCGGAAAAALPIGPAGAATQAGAGAAILVASGVGASQALEAAVAVGALGVLTGAAILIVAVGWRTTRSLIPQASR